jgi:hypothetical protein
VIGCVRTYDRIKLTHVALNAPDPRI